MKSFFSAAWISAALFSAVLFTGCTPKPSELIAGVWKIDNIDMGMEIPAEQKAMFDEMMTKMKETSSMDIKADGTYKQEMFMGQMIESTGKWSITEDGKTFITTEDKDGVTDSLNIVELTANKFVISASDRGRTTTISYAK
jgi:PBP1b-binding outer membrane lipoprotein LpoB